MSEQDRLNRLSQELLTPDILAETLHIFDKAMRHTPYAVSGMSALAAWGYTAKCPRHVSVVVPAYSKDTILSWAKPAGFETFASRPDLLGVPTADGKFRRIRLKYIESCDDDGWGDFRSVRLPIFIPPALANRSRSTEEDDMTDATPVVLQLPTLFNLAACSFVSDAARRSSDMRSNIARDIFWILGRMADRAPGEEGAGPLTPDAAAMLTDKDFWREFTFAFPKAPELFVRAGMSSSLVEEMVAEAEGRQPRRPYHRQQQQQQQQKEQLEQPPPTPPKDAKWQRTLSPTTSQLPRDDSRASWPHVNGKYEPYRPVSGSCTVDGRVSNVTATNTQSTSANCSSTAPRSRYAGLSAVPATLLPCGGGGGGNNSGAGGADWLTDWSRQLGRPEPEKNDPESRRQRIREGITPRRPKEGRQNPYRDE